MAPRLPTSRGKADATKPPKTRFSKFAEDVKGFEKTIHKLVASSFVVSAISTVVYAASFKSDPGLPAVALLIANIGGIAGVLVTYLASAQHPTEADLERRRFRTGPLVWRMSISFLLSAFAFFLFFYVSHEDRVASLAALPFATFFFFRGLVTGFLATHYQEAQEQEWNSLTVDERLQWLQQEREDEKRLEDLQHLVRSTKSSLEASRGYVRTARQNARRAKIDAFKRRLGRIYVSSIRFRHRLGNGFLLPSERIKLEIEDLKVGEVLKELDAGIAQEAFGKISNGEFQPYKIEGSDADFYRIQNRIFIIVREQIDKASADLILDRLKPLRDPESGKFRSLTAFMEGPFKVTAEGCDLLNAQGISIYKTSNWERLGS